MAVDLVNDKMKRFGIMWHVSVPYVKRSMAKNKTTGTSGAAGLRRTKTIFQDTTQ